MKQGTKNQAQLLRTKQMKPCVFLIACQDDAAQRWQNPAKQTVFFPPQMSDQGTIFKPLCVNKFVFSCYRSGTFSLRSF